MKRHEEGFDVVEVEDLLNVLKNNKSIKGFHVYDAEFDAYDYITGVYVDKDGDLIIRIGDDV